MFSMVVYNKIIPAQAMSSLAVLVTGMAFLLLADYAVKVSRAKFLGVAGVEADITIADRLFTKIIDLQYKSKKGSVGSLANTLKEYEQIREFFTSATLVTIIDMPFAIIFLIFTGWRYPLYTTENEKDIRVFV
jgi:ATP-binding cassette subfamily C protein LapB